MTLRQLGASSGTSHSTLAAYESGTKVPIVATLDRITRAAGFSLDGVLSHRWREADGMDRGDELIAVLDLAEQFPARHAPRLSYPPVRAVLTLVEQILSLDRGLVDAEIPHAFGGALALAWCTQRARATIDIDLNLFVDVDVDRAGDVLKAFPGGVRIACRDLAVFKTFFDRTKERADLEEMAAADTLDVEAVLGVLVRYLGGDDPLVARLRAVGVPPGG